MNLIALPQNMIKELEYNSVRLDMFIEEPLRELYLKILAWYHKNGLTTKDTNRNHVHKLMLLLGIAPSYYATYEFRFAVWGFSFKKQDFIMYYNRNKGLVIQIKGNFDKSLIGELLIELSNLLLHE
jgi:hypothetical protein